MKYFLIFLFFLVPSFSFTYIYDPGDFINSSKRSFSITEEFLNRWPKIYQISSSMKMFSGAEELSKNSASQFSLSKFFKEQQEKDIEDPQRIPFSEIFYDFNRGRFIHYFDSYFSQETISNIPLNSQFGIINMDYKRRVLGFTLKYENLFQDEYLRPGFAITGYGTWQGFTKTSIPLTGNFAIDNGNPSKNTFTDFYYNQVFDDFVVASFFLRPFGYIHAGLIINSEIDAVDGIFGNGNDILKKHYSRFFFQSNLFGFLSNLLQYNKENNKVVKYLFSPKK